MPKPIFPVNFADQAPKARIVQYNKKRYSIRLEPVFWRALEMVASDHDLKVGKFIGKLETIYQGPNFSSFLRVFCMISAERHIASAEADTNKDTLLSIINASPSPAALIAQDMTIIASNNAFYNWIGEDKYALEGSSINKLFQLRTKGLLQDNLKELLTAQTTHIDARVIRMIPGKVITAQARMVRASLFKQKKQNIVIWIASAPRLASPRSG
ncbi:ribbon-helix-helix domain-containing protein [Kiloniella sp. EL199]|uniref:ribbon-helix-helix domain-containing protein n=1 Tax=Kiloniella sp. EL199 TaxID=2107581 RepID=UPI000EA3E1E1|nr:ribbon-helix-helix domain-containing protein [Kiloniella sp. EL199]